MHPDTVEIKATAACGYRVGSLNNPLPDVDAFEMKADLTVQVCPRRKDETMTVPTAVGIEFAIVLPNSDACCGLMNLSPQEALQLAGALNAAAVNVNARMAAARMIAE